jgi:cell wall-associated NlpC family hydrolase
MTSCAKAWWPVLLLVGGCASQPTVERVSAPAPSAPIAQPSAEASDTGREIAMQAMSLLGVPYRYGGRSPATGLDCSGLVYQAVAKATGIVLPPDTRGMSTAGVEVRSDALRPGDLVFFNTLHRPYSHVGIYLGERRFIHAPSHGGVVEIKSLDERYWRRRYDGARRVEVMPPDGVQIGQAPTE